MIAHTETREGASAGDAAVWGPPPKSVGAGEPSGRQARSLKGPELARQLQRLRMTDNITNVWYLVGVWLFLAAVIGATVWFYHVRAAADLAVWWNVPITLVAIVLIGAGQHQLTGLAHEASHHILFRHRIINDLASDWFCMFPMFSCTHHYRLQHMAHHQFVNDPERDPDVSQLKTSGHWLAFPLSKHEFVRTLLRQLWIPNLIKYIRIRAKYNSVGSDTNPYLRKGWKQSRIPVRVGLAYILGQIVVLTGLVVHGDPLLLAVVPTLGWLAVLTFYGLIPTTWYHQSRVHPVISSRAMTMMRMTFITALFGALAWITLTTGDWAAGYFLLLWAAPMVTSFSFFMVLRQLVQHGNGDRGWLTNTRVFFVDRFIDFAVFPMGQDYHLPHHLFATVPHYRLKELHETLLDYPEYRQEAVIVEGYFLPKHRPPTHPTVLDVVGPAYAPHSGEVHTDDSVLRDDEVDEAEAILAEAARLRASGVD